MRSWVLWLLVAVFGVVAIVVVPVLVREAPDRLPIVGPSIGDIPHESVTFAGDGLQLAGMVMEPDDEPKGVAVFIHGAGTSKRDNRWYLGLAQHLQSLGLVVLLPDKRGSESSESDWRTASFEDLADDAEAAIAFMRQRYPELAVGVVGCSQGGWVAPIVANRDTDLAFVVNLSGSAVTPTEQLVHEEANNIIKMGAFGFVARAIAPVSAWTIRAFRQPDLWDRIGDFDPMPEWQRLSTPAFIAYGARDEFNNVPVVLSEARLAQAGNPLLEVKVYPEADHAIEDVATGRLNEQFLSDWAAFTDAALSR